MKLSARGRTVLATVSHTSDLLLPNALEPETGRKLRTDICLLSDGVVGIKRSWLKPDGRLDHSGGWKVKANLKPEAKARLRADQPGYVASWLARYAERGFKP